MIMEDHRILMPLADRIIDLALAEDLAYGDPTTASVLPVGIKARGRVVTRETIVVAGGPFFARVFEKLDPGVEVQPIVEEGSTAKTGDRIFEVKGDGAVLLAAERTALNLLSHLSGVATATRRYSDAVPEGTKTRITYTRKTLPGLGPLERYAVRKGGGFDHRPGLGAGILIKDNHIALVGSVKRAVQEARQRAPHPLRIEVEVVDEAGVKEALEAGADAILLDNMTADEAVRCASIIGGKAWIEVSGGVKIGDVAALARAGVDIVSVGGIIHSAPSVDVSFDISIG